MVKPIRFMPAIKYEIKGKITYYHTRYGVIAFV